MGIVFLGTFCLIPQPLHADLVLPKPGVMVGLSPEYVPVSMKGLTLHPNNPLLFDFIFDTGHSGLTVNQSQLKEESNKLIKYFLTGLALNDDDLWVNLSPYEKDHIVPTALGQTEMGRDMLAQDYILKQVTASLIYPEKGLGKKFWEEIYTKAQQQFGDVQIPVNTFNKVWIIPDGADVYVHNNTVYIVKAHLKVMLEEDYVATTKNANRQSGNNGSRNVTSQLIRELILPSIEKEINEGKNFSQLRQIYQTLILSTWFKETLKENVLSQLYANKEKTAGIKSDDPEVIAKIYQQYLAAYKKGVFNYISDGDRSAYGGKEDIDRISDQPIARKYFSGGTNFKTKVNQVSRMTSVDSAAGTIFAARTSIAPIDGAMTATQHAQQLQRVVTEEMRNNLSGDDWAAVLHGLGVLDDVVVYDQSKVDTIVINSDKVGTVIHAKTAQVMPITSREQLKQLLEQGGKVIELVYPKGNKANFIYLPDRAMSTITLERTERLWKDFVDNVDQENDYEATMLFEKMLNLAGDDVQVFVGQHAQDIEKIFIRRINAPKSFLTSCWIYLLLKYPVLEQTGLSKSYSRKQLTNKLKELVNGHNRPVYFLAAIKIWQLVHGSIYWDELSDVYAIVRKHLLDMGLNNFTESGIAAQAAVILLVDGRIKQRREEALLFIKRELENAQPMKETGPYLATLVYYILQHRKESLVKQELLGKTLTMLDQLREGDQLQLSSAGLAALNLARIENNEDIYGVSSTTLGRHIMSLIKGRSFDIHPADFIYFDPNYQYLEGYKHYPSPQIREVFKGFTQDRLPIAVYNHLGRKIDIIDAMLMPIAPDALLHVISYKDSKTGKLLRIAIYADGKDAAQTAATDDIEQLKRLIEQQQFNTEHRQNTLDSLLIGMGDEEKEIIGRVADIRNIGLETLAAMPPEDAVKGIFHLLTGDAISYRLLKDKIGAGRGRGYVLEYEDGTYNILYSPQRDYALIADTGGIDFNTQQIKIKHTGDMRPQMHVDPAMITQLREGQFTGLTPTILKMTVIDNLPQLLGVLQ